MDFDESGDFGTIQLPPNAAKRYQDLELIGCGGMGEVYRAHDVKLGRQVALKVISDEVVHHSSIKERFRREVQSMARLAHPRIVRLYDFHEEEGRAFYTMELVKGKTLVELTIERPMQPRRAVSIIAEAADGLAAAHREGILHRDVKAANILVDTAGHAKLMDFGLAQILDGDEGTKLTKTGRIVGTFLYLPPEILRGEKWDARCDVYQLGCALYYILTGKMPWTEPQLLGLVREMHKNPVEAPSQSNEACNEGLDTLVLDAIDPKAACRTPTADAFKKRCSDWLAGKEIRPTVARPPVVSRTADQLPAKKVFPSSISTLDDISTTTTGSMSLKRHRLLPITVAIATVLIAGVAFILSWQRSNGPSPGPTVTTSRPSPSLHAIRPVATVPTSNAIVPLPTIPPKSTASTQAPTYSTLLAAARHGKTEKCKAALSEGCSLDGRDQRGRSALMLAARFGHLEVVGVLLRTKIDLGLIDDRARTALHHAIENSHCEIAKILLVAGAPTDVFDANGSTPLHLAITQEDPLLVTLLLLHGASTEMSSPTGTNALDFALERKVHSNIRMLLAASGALLRQEHIGASRLSPFDVDGLITAILSSKRTLRVQIDFAKLNMQAKDAHYVLLMAGMKKVLGLYRTGWTKAHRAAWQADLALIDRFANNKDCLNEPDGAGRTPLHIAALRRSAEASQRLINHGASPNVGDLMGRTPLHLACRARANQLVAVLLLAGASPSKPDVYGITPLHIAAATGDKDVLGPFVKAGVPINAADLMGLTPLHWAAVASDEVSISLLVPTNPRALTTPQIRAFGPLHILLSKTSVQSQLAHIMAKRLWLDCTGATDTLSLGTQSPEARRRAALLLIKRRHLIDSSDPATGQTPLHLACRSNEWTLVDALLEAGASVEHADKHGNTPLHTALQTNASFRLLSLLIDAGAPLKLTNKAGASPIDLARKAGRLSDLKDIVRAKQR